MTREELDKLESLDSQATSAPWVLASQTTPHKGTINIEENGSCIETVATCYCGGLEGHGYRNAELLVMLRNNAQYLIGVARNQVDLDARMEGLRQLAERSNG